MTSKIFIQVDHFVEYFSLCYGQPYYIIKISGCVFSSCLEVWNGPPESYKFPFYKKIKIVQRLVPNTFQNQATEIQVEYPYG